jgi:hypothetical protein
VFVIEPADDYPHAVPPQAFMTWKENWVFPAVDPVTRVASLFHFSLRPGLGEGIFTAKFCIDGEEHRYVGRSPIPADLTTMAPVQNERITFEVVEPGQRFALSYNGPELEAKVLYTARFAPFDFKDGPLPEGESDLGDIGRSVFPFNHYEQALWHEGEITLKQGERAGETIAISGYGNRDHSWGWRSEFTWSHHHWLCASFDDRFVEGSVCEEGHFPHGEKQGGWISTEAGNDPVKAVDTSDGYRLTPGEPLERISEDVRYTVQTVGGEQATVTFHLGEDYGRLYLDARTRDRTKTYQDVQMFCNVTLEDTGQTGTGVLEVGTLGSGSGVADDSRWRRTASRA